MALDPAPSRSDGGRYHVSVRFWKWPQVRQGGRVGLDLFELDAVEPDHETLRDRAAHVGPIDDDTLVYRIELHAVSAED
jgi:hypothetical protein